MRIHTNDTNFSCVSVRVGLCPGFSCTSRHSRVFVCALVSLFIFTAVAFAAVNWEKAPAALRALGPEAGLNPAGSPLPTIQIEPIQPVDELASINPATAEGSGSISASASNAAQTAAILPAAAEGTDEGHFVVLGG